MKIIYGQSSNIQCQNTRAERKKVNYWTIYYSVAILCMSKLKSGYIKILEKEDGTQRSNTRIKNGTNF